MARTSGIEGLWKLSSGEEPSIKVAAGSLDDLLYVDVTEQPEGLSEFRADLVVRWHLLDDWVLGALYRAGLPALGSVVVLTERLDSGIHFGIGLSGRAFLKARVALRLDEDGGSEIPLTFFYETGREDKGGWLGKA